MTCRASLCAQKLAALTGWRRNAAAFFLGALATLTLSPFYIFLLLIPAYGGLFILVDSATSRRRHFWDGWFWGWGYFMTGLYWFCVALMTDEAFEWLIPFALFGLTGIIAIYPGLACLLMAWLKKTFHGPARLIIFTLIFTGVETARGILFTGFPWNLPGYAFGFSEPGLQLASLLGPYGLTAAAILFGISPLFARGAKPLAATIWLMLGLSLLWGEARIPDAPMPTVPGIKLRLVQANIAQPHKWDPRLQMQGMQKHITLMHSPGLENITHIIWPETAVPYVFQENSDLSRLLGGAIPEGKLLFTGTLRVDGEDYATANIYNSLMAINHEGRIVGNYDKAHLVPFGEFQPIRPYVPKEWMTPVGDKDFAWGTASQVLNWPATPPLLPLICYEAIFPEMAQAAKGEGRPAWLLNVTNDAWFGLSTGPRQHFEMARMRAVEQGVPLVRVANTGISAVIDPYGRPTALLPLGTQGILDANLPQALESATIYTKYHKLSLPALALCMLGMAFFLNKRRTIP